MMNSKYTIVIEDIRKQILDGHWKPRHRIPIREELISRYNTSRATIQKAIDELLREGFITSNGKSGTFVSITPPNLNSVAVIFPSAGQDSGSWDQLWSLFVGQKRYFEKKFNRIFVFYFLTDGGRDCPEFIRLRNDAAGSKLSGIIMPFPPSETILDELRQYHVPMVAVTREDFHKDLNTVWLDYDSFFSQAISHIKSQKCRTAALIINYQLPGDYVENFVTEAARNGINVPENLIQGAGLEHLAQPWITRLIRLMMQPGSTGRPDALIVANQNLLDAVINGLQQEHLVVGKDIELIVHTNFPSQRPNGFDVLRIGFNVHKILDVCIATLAKSKTEGRIIHNAMVPAERE
jgi:hypothetical protein